MNAFTNLVSRKLLFLLVLQIQVLTSLSITVNKLHNDIPTVTRTIELKSVSVTCLLNDIVRISAPLISKTDKYYLFKPNGDTIKLNLKIPKKLDIKKEQNSTESYINVKFYPNINTIIEQSESYDVFDVRNFKKKLKFLEANEFLLGPLLEEDYGNWILSIYTKDTDGEWTEIFKTFTMAITEYIQLRPEQYRMRIGDTLTLSFAYPITGIETCEIVAPRSTFDRFFTRDINNFNKCTFTIPNITREDEGIWRIIGVGRITYSGAVFVNLLDDFVYIWS